MDVKLEQIAPLEIDGIPLPNLVYTPEPEKYYDEQGGVWTPYNEKNAKRRLVESGLSDTRSGGGLSDCDAALLRIQRERLQGSLLPSLREYSRTFGISERTLAAAPADAIIMHPGPMNRGVEIESEIADGDRAVILEQVTNGIAIRMAALYLVNGGQQDAL